mmetsp:Transcript_6255/g.17925  ORF Transcript_6255/g.17925 Transcript_6255/m.17925 type:complete len:149 (+) Transcript_6255:248-694(+)
MRERWRHRLKLERLLFGKLAEIQGVVAPSRSKAGSRTRALRREPSPGAFAGQQQRVFRRHYCMAQHAGWPPAPASPTFDSPGGRPAKRLTSFLPRNDFSSISCWGVLTQPGRTIRTQPRRAEPGMSSLSTARQQASTMLRPKPPLQCT